MKFNIQKIIDEYPIGWDKFQKFVNENHKNYNPLTIEYDEEDNAILFHRRDYVKEIHIRVLYDFFAREDIVFA